MSVLTRLYRGQTDFDFVGRRRIWLAVSGSLIAVSLMGLVLGGLNLSVDFVGGTLIEAPNPTGTTVAEMRTVLRPLDLESSQVQLLGGGETIRVQTGALDPDLERRLIETVADEVGTSPDDVSVDTVGPTWGAQITRQALRALVIFLLAASAFISWRFEWKMAAAALVALVHDLVITAGFYALSGLEVTPATVIAILTILGYSLYDTVVVFDKVVENVGDQGDRVPYGGIVNLSMNQVLMRSVNTSLTSLLPVGSLLVAGTFLGASTLQVFALALFVGMAMGTYSSIAVASPVLSAWKEQEDRWERARHRLARRDDAEWDGERPDRPEPARARPPASTGATPRPPRQRRRKRR